MVMVGNPALHVLRQGLKDTDLTHQELFERYRARGGKNKQPNTIGAWLRGERDVPYIQLMLLFGVVNDELRKQGKSPVVVPFTLGLVEDEPAVSSAADDEAMGGSPSRFPALNDLSQAA